MRKKEKEKLIRKKNKDCSDFNTGFDTNNNSNDNKLEIIK